MPSTACRPRASASRPVSRRQAPRASALGRVQQVCASTRSTNRGRGHHASSSSIASSRASCAMSSSEFRVASNGARASWRGRAGRTQHQGRSACEATEARRPQRFSVKDRSPRPLCLCNRGRGKFTDRLHFQREYPILSRAHRSAPASTRKFHVRPSATTCWRRRRSDRRAAHPSRASSRRQRARIPDDQ